MVDATIVIGLLILLTFSSISSPFVETEQSEFFAEWYDVQRTLRQIDNMLIDCQMFSEQPYLLVEKSESALLSDEEFSFETRPGIVIQQGVENIEGEPELYDSDNLKIKLTDRCEDLIIEKVETENHLDVLNTWGVEFSYLEEGEGKMVESIYSKNLASGPLTVNLVNLVMIFPFLISMFLDTVIKFRKDSDTEDASKLGMGFMVAGVVAMIMGLLVISNEFYFASKPFLDF